MSFAFIAIAINSDLSSDPTKSLVQIIKQGEMKRTRRVAPLVGEMISLTKDIRVVCRDDEFLQVKVDLHHLI